MSAYAPRSYWKGITPGDTVKFATPQGGMRTGKVVMAFAHHVVLNTGGRYGTPAVVDDKNYMNHWKKAQRKQKQHSVALDPPPHHISN